MINLGSSVKRYTNRSDRVADDIERVRKAEMRRGRRPLDFDTIQEKRRVAAALREIYDHGTIEELKDAMREYGLSEKMPEWIETVRIWIAERGRR
jgi:hypothetical protein